jgi:hypothetical protein
LTGRRRLIALALASIGLAVLVGAGVANQQWFDRHFLPSFLLPRRWYTLIYLGVRWTIAAVAAGLVLGARPIASRVSARGLQNLLRVLFAAVLAVVAGEAVLRQVRFGLTGWLSAEDEPRRRADPRLGWTLVPARTAHMTIGGRTIAFAIDPAGYRVRSADQPVDPDRPTILFVGESVMFGEGLTWDESVPGQVGALMKTQVANLAVHGFSTDQAYLRLRDELPRFRDPVAVVSLFMPALVGRDLNDDRPHLGPNLTWSPAISHSRIKSLATFLMPYRRDETVERGIAVTRQVLRAIVNLARARGATPLILVPQFGPEAPVERALRHRIVDQSGLPYILVEIEGTWRLPWDRHPNARAAAVMAQTVAARLSRR